MRIGIPRALYSFYHYPQWHRFVTELGGEVVLSPATNRDILAQGVSLAPAETCLPVKAYLGHVAWLRDKCDAVMIERLVCVKQRGRPRFGCPKAIALPDLVRATVPDLPPILELVQDERKTKLADSYLKFGKYLDPDHRGKLALTRATTDQLRVTELLRAGMPLANIWKENRGQGSGIGDQGSGIGNQGPEPRSPTSGPRPPSGDPRPPAPDTRHLTPLLRIGVIGHPYLIFDSLLGLNLPDRLRDLGIDARYSLAVPEEAVFPEPARNREISWLYEHELLGAAWYFMNREPVDGLLLVSSFACGTSAVINEIISRELLEPHVPVMTLLLDEHSAESGLVTRLEAFADLVRHRKATSRRSSPNAETRMTNQ